MDRSPTRQFPDQTLPRPDISPTDTSPRTDRQFPNGQVPDKKFARTEISQYFPNCKGNHDSAHYVIAENIAVAGGALLVETPKMETIRRDVRRQRAVLTAHPPITDDTLLQIPNPYDLTTTGEQFLQYDNGRHDRIIIFWSTESLNIGS